MDAGQQLAHPKRLGDVVISAQLQAQNLVGFFYPGREQDDGRSRLAVVDADELIAVHLRHHNVEQDQVGLLVARHVERFASVGCYDDAEALLGQVISHQRANTGFVIDDEDGLGHWTSTVNSHTR